MRQTMTSQQVRYVRLLEMNEQEVEAAVERELDDNPALERADVAVATVATERYIPREQLPSRPDLTPIDADDSESLAEHLSTQIGELTLPDDIRETALYIIGNIDSNGYLQRSENAMIDDIAFSTGIEVSPQTMHEALVRVRSLDPAGVGAYNLQDTLKLQLERMKPSESRDDAMRIVSEEFEEFSLKHSHRLISKLKLPAARIDKALRLIRTLNPKPGSAVGTGRRDVAAAVVPDFQVDVDASGQITVSFSSNIPSLVIEEGFEQAYRRMKERKQARIEADDKFVATRYRDARDFINILQQRRDTLYSVMTAIVKLQKEYFITGDEQTMQPMTLKDVAAMIGMDVSTVSRATAAKYVATPGGVLPLKFFFSEGYGADEDRVSARSVQAALRELVEKEDKKHPLSDEALCRLLAGKGYEVSRRTVAKYRNNLNLPVARLRKGM
ncbi:MAG: RNA polymerase factor sigma-54 [Lachnospiraceae bacterium]|nr:RNA polymerase factor sigma-54 [Lachnospiraceae bacterium]